MRDLKWVFQIFRKNDLIISPELKILQDELFFNHLFIQYAHCTSGKNLLCSFSQNAVNENDYRERIWLPKWNSH